MQRDLENDQKLQFLGWTVIHFWGKEIKKDLDGCIRVIEEAIFENMIAENEADTHDE
jgi:DNA mismatch endonuclease (patch repair protein)